MRACSQRIKKIAVFYLTFLFVFGFSSVVLAGSSENAEDRDVLVDHALGGMKEGSRILSPEGYTEKTAIPQAPGSKLAPTIDTQALSSSRGSEKAAVAGPGAEGISSGAAGSISGPVGAGAGVGGGTGGIGTGGGSVGAGSEGGSEGAGPSPGSGATLIDVDANVNLGSGTVDAGVGIDTNAGIQESTILDADLSATGGGTAADISSATDISGQDVTSDSSLVVESSETALSPESDLGTEVDTSGSSVGGETDVGIEAAVSGTGAGDDVGSDPADGLPAGL